MNQLKWFASSFLAERPPVCEPMAHCFGFVRMGGLGDENRKKLHTICLLSILNPWP